MVAEKDLESVHEKIFKGEEVLTDSISRITNNLDRLQKDIKQVKCDISGKKYYVFIDTAGKSFFPKCCLFTNPQLEYLKQVLTGIVLSTEGVVGKMEAINSCRGMSKSEADETLSLFVKEKILLEYEGGRLYMSPIAIVEFGPFFESCFSGNLTTCDLCKQLVFVATPCKGCGEGFHKHCVAMWLKNKHRECPKCSLKWK